MKREPIRIDIDRGMYLDIPRSKSRAQIKALEKKWSSDPTMKLFFKGIRGRKAYMEFTSPEQRDKMLQMMAKCIEKQGDTIQHVELT